MADDAANEIVKTWERLKGARGTFDSHWQDVTNHLLPDRADYLVQRTPGARRMQFVYDSGPGEALDRFAAGLHSRLTSPTQLWFMLRAEDDKVDQDPDARAWLDDTTQRMYATFNSARHNFASQSHELYLDLGSIGNGCMAVLDSPRIDTLFSTRHMRECVWEENDEDRVDALTRRWEYTAKQAMQSWGPRAGEKVAKAFEDKPDTKFAFLHSVRPRKQRNPLRGDNQHMAWESVYVSEADRSIISVGGFNEFPYLAARFAKSPGETYGRGPGLRALPDIKMLMEMVKTIIKAAQKIVDPPLMLPDDGYVLPIRTVPGGLIFHRPGIRDELKPLETKGNIQIGLEMLNRLEGKIMRQFYADMMTMPADPADPASAGKGVTATFTQYQLDMWMQLLSPMLARLNSEFLGPLIDRVFALKWRKSMTLRFGPGAPLAPPPSILSGRPLRVEYVSPIAIAQKASANDNITRLVQMAVTMIQLNPAAAQSLDTDEILRIAARNLNTPARVLKTPERIAAEQQAAAHANAIMNAHAQMANVAGAAKDGSAAVANLAQAANMNQGQEQAA